MSNKLTGEIGYQFLFQVGKVLTSKFSEYPQILMIRLLYKKVVYPEKITPSEQKALDNFEWRKDE